MQARKLDPSTGFVCAVEIEPSDRDLFISESVTNLRPEVMKWLTEWVGEDFVRDGLLFRFKDRDQAFRFVFRFAPDQSDSICVE